MAELKDVKLDMEKMKQEMQKELDDIKKISKNKNMSIPYNLPTYVGIKDPKRFEEFLDEFYDICNSHGLDYTVCCKLIRCCLRREARAIYDSLSNETKEDWKKLIDELAKAFAEGDPDAKNRTHEQLLQRKQKSDETVMEFGYDISKLVNSAYSDKKGFKNENRSEMKLLFFTRGLKPEIRVEVMRKSPTTYDEALKAARKEEGIQTQVGI